MRGHHPDDVDDGVLRQAAALAEGPRAEDAPEPEPRWPWLTYGLSFRVSLEECGIDTDRRGVPPPTEPGAYLQDAVDWFLGPGAAGRWFLWTDAPPGYIRAPMRLPHPLVPTPGVIALQREMERLSLSPECQTAVLEACAEACEEAGR